MLAFLPAPIRAVLALLLFILNTVFWCTPFYINDRRPLPIPSAAAGRPMVRPSALESAKLALYAEMTTQGVRKSELARRLGWRPPQVDRLFD